MGRTRPWHRSQRSAVLYNVACDYALLGESEKAIACLEKTLIQGEWYKGWAEHDSDLDSIRAHPRFQAMMKSIGT